jgi:conjugative relaxase-like TrwC/TraI family protein
MLKIHEVTSATDAKNYYAASDYYSQGQETVGQWGGKLADQLGLSGKVTKKAFDRMVDNLHPVTGRQLTPRTKENRRVGYDFTVSVPQSASLLRAFASDGLGDELDAARDRAIAGMMAEVEADMQTRVRKDGAAEDRTTGNLVYAAFHHTTSRPVPGKPPDMHEHSHLLCFNATMDPEEDRIKAGQFGNLKRDGEYFAAVFDALYARELETLGFGIDRQGGKKWEVANIPASMVEKSSKRTDEVEDEAARRGIIDAVRKAELGAKTRSKKQKELTKPELLAAWDAQLTDAERDALAAVHLREASGGSAVTPAEAVAYAIAHIGEKLSVFPERELHRALTMEGPPHPTAGLNCGRAQVARSGTLFFQASDIRRGLLRLAGPPLSRQVDQANRRDRQSGQAYQHKDDCPEHPRRLIALATGEQRRVEPRAAAGQEHQQSDTDGPAGRCDFPPWLRSLPGAGRVAGSRGREEYGPEQEEGVDRAVAPGAVARDPADGEEQADGEHDREQDVGPAVDGLVHGAVALTRRFDAPAGVATAGRLRGTIIPGRRALRIRGWAKR